MLLYREKNGLKNGGLRDGSGELRELEWVVGD